LRLGAADPTGRGARNDGVHTDSAQLTAIASALDELTGRVTAIADRHAGRPPEEAVAGGLYDVERNLQAAARRLAAVLRQLR